MTGDEPLISIAIPARNGLAQLEQTLQSIAESEIDMASIEVVVADDGSTDGTYECYEEQTFPFRFRILRGDWHNQSMATNEAILHCTGRYVLLTAQDIVFHPRLISEHLKWHERFEGEEIAVLGYLPYPEDLDVTPFMYYLVNGGNQFCYQLIKDPLRVPPNYVYAPNFSMRRATLDRVGMFDEKLPYGYQDTDLGIRMVEAGVRVVYNQDAVGYHNHRQALPAYLERQEKVAAGGIRLREKHPYHEAELPCWDVVVEYYLIYSQVRYEQDLIEISKLEQELERRPEYKQIWDLVWNRAEDPSRFTQHRRETVGIVDRLFGLYARVTQHHWAKGYLEEGIQRYGPAKVEAVLHARLSKLQASIPTYRLVDRRFEEHALSPWKFAGISRSTRIVYGIENYEDAVHCLEPYLAPGMPIFNQQLLLVIEVGRLVGDELANLDDVAEIVRCDSIEQGIAEAVDRAQAEVISIASASIDADEQRAAVVAEKIFGRMERVAVLGGSIRAPGETRLCYGYRIDGESGAEPLVGSGEDSGPVPVDAAIPEFLVVRRSAASGVLDRLSGGEAWHLELCRRITADGGMILHVPEYAATHHAERVIPVCEVPS